MTHEDATAYAKARAYDGETAYVMRCRRNNGFRHDLGDTGYTFTHVVSEASRAAHEAQGWEVVETYVPQPLLESVASPYHVDGA